MIFSGATANDERRENCEIHTSLQSRWISFGMNEIKKMVNKDTLIITDKLVPIAPTLSLALFSTLMPCAVSQHEDSMRRFVSKHGNKAVDLIGKQFFPSIPESMTFEWRELRVAILSALDANLISY